MQVGPQGLSDELQALSGWLGLTVPAACQIQIRDLPRKCSTGCCDELILRLLQRPSDGQNECR